jgi:ELWxxDGT repeat protein
MSLRTTWFAPLLSAVLLGGLAGLLRAEGPIRQVKDINTAVPTPAGGVCLAFGPFVGLGPAALLAAESPTLGCELFRLEASSWRTSLVRDLILGPISSELRFEGSLGSLALFTANTREWGIELWRSDGTAVGTYLLRDIAPAPWGAPEAFPTLRVLGQVAIFGAQDPEHGAELWRTDGTPGGTVLVTDLCQGSGDSIDLTYGGFQPEVLGSFLYFAGSDGVSSAELWRTDGTPEGTGPVADLGGPGVAIHPEELTAVGSRLFFFAAAPPAGWQLWVSDGTGGGTAPVFTFSSPWLEPRSLVAAGARAFFLAWDPLHGTELWTSDGTSGGTSLVREIVPGVNEDEYSRLWPVGARVYFFASDGASGSEPWVSDGTAAGTVPLGDLNPGLANSDLSWIKPGPDFTSCSGGALFGADDGASGPELWWTDGTASGTRLAVDLLPGESGSDPWLLGSWQGRCAVAALADPGGREVYLTDGTAGGTQRVTFLGSEVTPSAPRQLTGMGGTLILGVSSALSGPGAWRSDGTEDGTYALAGELGEFCTSCGSCCEFEFLSLPSGWTLGLSTGNDTGDLLWSTEGEAISPLGEFVRSCGPHCTSGIGSGLHAAGEVGVFQWETLEEGAELWASDGSPPGTGLLADIRPGPDSSLPSSFAPFGDRAIFVANDGVHGREPWVTAGTGATTEILLDLAPGSTGFSGSSFWEFAPVPGSFFFQRVLVAFGPVELWFFDPSTSSQRKVAEGFDYFSLERFGEAGGRLVFAAAPNDAWQDEDLWATDGTPGGTYLLRDFPVGETTWARAARARLGDRIFFRGCEGATGCELWASDGTVAGTALVRDFLPGPRSSWPSGLASIGGRLYLGLCQDAAGCEPWISDGTAAGSHRAGDIAGGPGSGVAVGEPGYPAYGVEFERSGDLVLFPADDGTGSELWAVRLEIFYDGFETGDPSRW